MNIDVKRIEIGGVEIKTLRKDIKNVHLGVYPPNGRVRVAAPLSMNDDAIRCLIISRMPWIKKQQTKYFNQERESKREFVSGESHYFFGNRYRLNVIPIDSDPRIEINKKSFIDFFVKFDTTMQKKEKFYDKFCRKELKNQIIPLISKWEKKMGLKISSFQIKKMKTKWGSCNINKRKILFNFELIKKPLHCTEYIVVHELVHLMEKKHTNRFIELMNTFLPQWRQYRDELNNAPLGYGVWNY